MKVKKVFIGLTDIASFISDWDAGFKANGVQTLRGVKSYQYKIQNSKVDFVIEKSKDRIGYFKPGRISVKVKPLWNKIVDMYYLRKAIFTCDTFIFFCNSFYPDYSDYELLKRKGKKIITMFIGDDIRWEPAMTQEFSFFGLDRIEYENYDYSTSALNRQLIFLRVAEKFSDLIISQPNLSQLALRPYYNFFIPIILKEYTSATSQEQRKIPVIVHAPTSIGKGTAFVEAAIDKLKQVGIEFEYKRIENIPRQEALKQYNDSDIIIDQLLTPGGGKLSHESLAMGKVTLTLMCYETYEQKRSKECPIIDVNKETIYDVLKELIPDQKTRIEIAAKGKPYIEKHHNPGVVIKKLLEQIENVELSQPDFYPTFFRNKFVPESEESINLYNNWTNYVSSCDWYKNNIESGVRGPLKF